MLNRRQFVSTLGAAAVASRGSFAAQTPPPTPVSIAKCKTYGSELVPTLSRMFDQIGGLGKLVKGKTVAIKINLTGSSNYRLGFTPAELAHWTHPAVLGATVHLLGRAGAHRIRIVECPWSTAEPVEEVMHQVGWDVASVLNAAPRVEFENTNWLGNGKKYSILKTPHGGHMFKEYALNHSYEDCDVFATVTKIKEHATAGITLALKNSFGITPCTIYGEGAGKDEPSVYPRGGRGLIHSGHRQPAGFMENDPKSPREGGYRVPRVVADLSAVRPIDLCVLDGIATMTGGEGPWIRNTKAVWANYMVVGTNPVCTDAVTMATMGFDPMADRGKAPFERCDNHLRLAEELGVGTRDVSKIEVVGAPIRDVLFKFRDGSPRDLRS